MKKADSPKRDVRFLHPTSELSSFFGFSGLNIYGVGDIVPLISLVAPSFLYDAV